MAKNEKANLWVNRIVSLIIAGGVMFLIMNYGVTDKLRKELDSTKFASVRLFDDAKAFFDNENYAKAMDTLDTLFEKRPGSDEALEGQKLYALIELMQNESDSKWESAEASIRAAWELTTAAELRGDLIKEGEDLEKNMESLLNSEWEKTKDSIRKNWEKEA
jgi:predicted negative regulator of RcsB-dependent stress response